jgi:hypothetical protein
MSFGATAYGLYLAGTQTVTSGGTMSTILISNYLEPTSGATNAIGINAQPNIIAPNGQTITNAMAHFVGVEVGGNVGTITSGYGIYVSAGSSGAGTITTGYGIYCLTPGYASTNICAYFQGPIKLGTSTTGATTCTLGTNSPSSGTTPNTWLEFLKSDGTTLYVPAYH